MSKETVFINVQGSPFGDGPLCGENTHMRGEGVWMLDVALNMARHGHEVTILAYQWGVDMDKCPLPKHVTLQKEFRGECDIFMDSGWDDECAPQRYKDIKAKCYIHGWHGDPFGSSFLKYAKEHGIEKVKNHYIAGMSRAFKYYCDKYPYSIYVPIPVVDKIKAVPNIYSKKMLWANKGAFHIVYAKYSEQVLEFMEKYPEYKYTVLFYGDIIERATNEINRPDIIERLKNLPNADLIEEYRGITHDKFIKELDESIFLLDNGQPSIHPQSIEALCMGCVPLIWKVGDHQHHFQAKNYESVPSKFGMEEFNNADVMGNSAKNEKEIVLNVERLMNDRNFHIEYYNSLKNVMIDHEYNNAYDILMNEVYNRIY